MILIIYLIIYLSNIESISSDANIESSFNKHDEIELQKLIKRLIPYSQNLQGSVTHIAYERAKLMAMIPSPTINKLGIWRLFFTVAPADMYENRFYEVVQSPIIGENDESWKIRTIFNVNIYSNILFTATNYKANYHYFRHYF